MIKVIDDSGVEQSLMFDFKDTENTPHFSELRKLIKNIFSEEYSKTQNVP